MVDDDGAHATIISRTLNRVGYSTVVAYSLADGVERLLEEKPFLVCTDLHLPGVTPAQVVASFTGLRPDVPVIVLTSSVRIDDAVLAMKSGARDFIVKNFDGSFEDVLLLGIGRVRAVYELEQERKALAERLEYFRLAVEQGNQIFAVIDGLGRVLYDNALGTKRRSERGAIGLSGWLPQTVFEALLQQLATLSPLGVWDVEFEENSEIWGATVTLVRRGVEPENGVAIVWLRQVTEQRRREVFHRELLSAVTHDLRSPLSAILLSGQLIWRKAQSDDRVNQVITEASARIVRSAQRGMQLVDTYLTARQAEEACLVLQPQVTELGPLIELVRDEFEPLLENKSLVLSLEVGVNSWTLDPSALNRVLSNIVSNAIRFSPIGGEIRLSACLDDAGMLRIEIADEGPGIPEGVRSSIFGKFRRFEQSAGSVAGGLGLHVVDVLVQSSGGYAEVDITSSGGTLVRVCFPSQAPVNGEGSILCVV